MQPPARFHKYRSMQPDSLKWVRRTVLEHEIYFARAMEFNDPFDLRPAVTLEAPPALHRERYLASSRLHEPDLPEAQRQAQADVAMAASMRPEAIAETTRLIQARLGQAVTSDCGVYCVSTHGDDILMWSHYGDFHRGVCLVFDGHGPLMAHAKPVVYAPERAALNPYLDDLDTLYRKALLTKSDHWAYEREWRLLRYDLGPGIEVFTPPNLVGVIVGAMATASAIDEVRSWARQRQGPPLELSRAVMSETTFELRIEPLPA